MLIKGVYPHEYMDDKEMSEKEEFYSNWNMEGIIDPDYMHGKSF